MSSGRFWLGTVGAAALLTLAHENALADTLADNPLIATSGDGIIFSDPEEGVLEPGVKAVTFTRTRVEDINNPGEFLYLEPFEVIIKDFSSTNDDIESRGDVVNCLMANNPQIYCDSAPGSGKRIKVQLTGPTPFDITYATTPNGTYLDQAGDPVDTSSVDYFTFGKVSNFTGARMTGFSLQLVDVDGNPMGDLDASTAAHFNLDATAIGLGSRLPDGLFGEGGNEGDIGFFSDARAGLTLTASSDMLEFGELSNGNYVANFGTAFLDNSMVPEGLFWDDNENPEDESALLAWDNIAGGGWTYGTVATADDLAGRLVEIAGALGVEVSELGYVDGGLVPDDIIAAAQSNGLFAVDAIEDLRNSNLNYDITIGEIEGGAFTLRWVPEFAPIVQEAQTEFEFKAAGYLDAAANVPYWDSGNAVTYVGIIDEILALDEADRAAALTSTAFSIAPAFTNLGFETGRDQVRALTEMAPIEPSGLETVSQQAGAASWSMTNDLYGLFSLGKTSATYDETSGMTGYDIGSTSFTAGLERRLDTDTTAGFALGITNATADTTDNFGSIASSGVSIAAFTRSRFGAGNSIEAIIGFQDLSYDTTRPVLGETALGSTNGSQIFAALSAESLREFGALKIGPSASFEYYNTRVDGFSETGADALNLTVGDQRSSTVVASVGMSAAYELSDDANPTILSGGVAYTAASGDELAFSSGFVGLPGTAYSVAGFDQDLLEVSIGFENTLSSNASRNMSFSGRYIGAFGSDYESQSAQLGLNIQF